MTSLNDVPEANKGGNCYFNCLTASLREFLSIPDLKIVHGEVGGQGPLTGIRYGHAWLELSDQIVWDHNGGMVQRDVFYRIGAIDPDEVDRYSRDEAVALALQHNDCGPWGEKGNARLHG
jgi:hypothetical protein